MTTNTPVELGSDLTLPPVNVLRVADINEIAAPYDARDILECYWLLRPSRLDGLPNVTITKQALGIRYRRPTTSASYLGTETSSGNPEGSSESASPSTSHKQRNKKPLLELTLEYGPLRAGPQLWEESIPQLIPAPEEDASNGTSFKRITWSNEGRVYVSWAHHDQMILPDQYPVAHYVGSMTGAVLQNLLKAAQQYHLQYRASGHRVPQRYQPFQVVLDNTESASQPAQMVLLEPNNDDNFLAFLFGHLAMTGVDLAPLLPPTTWKMRLHVEAPARSTDTSTTLGTAAMEKVTTQDEPVARDIAEFYQSLYACVEAMATRNYTFILSQARIKQGANSTEAASSRLNETEARLSASSALTFETLLNGDAQAMAETVSRCFSDPVFGLVPDDGDHNATTTAYLYWDGTVYYKVHLTPPYLSVVESTRGLPRPGRLFHVDNSVKGGRDEWLVDWFLALVILALFALFVLVLLQQVLGRNLRIIKPLYKYQRWFFDPLHHNLHDHGRDGINDNDTGGPVYSGGRRAVGRGMEYTFGEDVIPLSMGGRRVSMSYDESEEHWLQQQDQSLNDGSGSDHNRARVHSDDNVQYHHDAGDLELTATSWTSSGSGQRLRTLSNGSLHDHSDHSTHVSAGTSTLMAPESNLRRMTRDPELVDLPNLSSRSKVAIPVGVSTSTTVTHGSGHSSSSFEDGLGNDNQSIA